MIRLLWSLIVSVVLFPFKLLGKGILWLYDYLSSDEGLPEIREYVYLDDVSVYSLLASTTGELTMRRTRRELDRSEQTSRKELLAELSGGSLGYSKKDVDISETESTVARQSVIQSKFKELYEARSDELILNQEDEIDLSQIGTEFDGDALYTHITENSGENKYSAASINRGDLVEVQVELSSERIYDYYTVFDDLLDLLREHQGVLDIDDQQVFELGDFFVKTVDTLLVDLIPIVGEVQTHQVVQTEDDRRYVLPSDIAEPLDDMYESVSTAPLKVSGLIEEELLWQDKRRVLFDDEEYTIFCRVDSPQLQEDWNPLKLADVVENVSDDSATKILNLPEELENSNEGVKEEDFLKSISEELQIYTDYLEERHGEIQQIFCDYARVVAMADHSDSRRSEFDIRRDIYEEYTDILETHLGYEISSRERTKFREGAKAAQNNVDGVEESNSTDDSEEFYLESSIVAIYW